MTKYACLILSVAYHFPILYFSIIKNEQSLDFAAEILKSWDWYYFSLLPIFLLSMYFDVDFIYMVIPSILIYALLFYFFIG
jgi:hypothetical protein